MPYRKAASGALLCVLLVPPGFAGAEVNGVSEPDPAEGLWQRSRETAEAWWENSRSLAHGAWEQTQDWWLTGDDEDQTFGQLWRDLPHDQTDVAVHQGPAALHAVESTPQPDSLLVLR